MVADELVLSRGFLNTSRVAFHRSSINFNLNLYTKRNHDMK